MSHSPSTFFRSYLDYLRKAEQVPIPTTQLGMMEVPSSDEMCLRQHSKLA